MPTDKELMQQALNALEHLQTDIEWQYKSPTRTMLRKVEQALRARLAQPNEFNPDWDAVAVMVEEQQRMAKELKTQREWQGLTDEEVVDRANAEVFAEAFARGVAWAELKLKEKNNG